MSDTDMLRTLETLENAIRKARKNGLNGYVKSPFFTWFEIIYNHDFAKAFFGEKDMWAETKCTCESPIDFHIFGHDSHDTKCARPKSQRGYKFHLAKMVVEENPLKYLQEFLDGKIK